MTTEPTAANLPSTLLEEGVGRTGLSWLQVTGVVGVVLILFLAATAVLAGVPARPFDVSFLRAGLLYPVVIIYILLMLPLLKRLRNSAIKSFRPLAQMDDDAYKILLAQAPIFNRRWEWLAVSAGAAGGLLLWRPWDAAGPARIWQSWGSSTPWLVLYALVVGGLMTGLLGWSIYSSLSGMRLFTGLQHCPLAINLFDLKPLQPIGRWSLGIALFYIGGNVLSVLLAPQLAPGVEAFVLYGLLILTPVLVFFLNMLSTRQTIAGAKERHVDMARQNLAAASLALENEAGKDRPERIEALLGTVAAWVTYEERVKAVPEWPYTAEIKRNLVLSTLLPVALWSIREFGLDFLKALVSVP